jgi:hypothetical protein
VIVAAIWIRRLAETNSIRPEIDFIFLGSWVPDLFDAYACHPPLFAGNMPP